MFMRKFWGASILAPSLSVMRRFQRVQTTSTPSKVTTTFRDLPPSFDIVKPNNTELAKGVMLRIQYLQQNVVVNFLEQVASMTERQQHFKIPARRVTLYFPTVYIARVLGVLEGSVPQCDIASRSCQGVFMKGSDPNTYVLKCTTIRMGDDKAPATEYTVPIDCADSVLLHRFLVQALHYNCGFGFPSQATYQNK